MKHERILLMKQFIIKYGSVTNEKLIAEFKISLVTLRRDLDEICIDKHFTKVYGGVIYNLNKPAGGVEALSIRKNLNREEKMFIGELAASLVNDGDVIFVDSGTTACNLIPYIATKADITLITHSLDVIEAAKEYANLNIICVGGKYNNKYNSFYNDINRMSYKINKAFIATVGIDLEAGFTNTDFFEGLIKKQVIKNSKTVILMADHSKFNNLTFNNFAEYKDINVLITGKKPSLEFVDKLKENNIELIYRAK